MSAVAAATAATTRYTLADFEHFGRHSQVHYRLPRLKADSRRPESVCIAEGRVTEHTIARGATLLVSDILVRHDYESSAQAAPHLACIVLLNGRARLQMGQHDDLTLSARGGVQTASGEPVRMGAMHHAGQRLRSINVAVYHPDLLGDDELAERVERAMRGSRLRHWSVPDHLIASIENLLTEPWQGTLHGLLRDGVGMQLLAHALANTDDDMAARPTALSVRDGRLLERVRACLHAAPGEDHRLEDLAKLACMSPSTLRAKFRAHFGCSVFDWLRGRRLDVARERLAQGWTVQQAAHYVGYRHATNFATAFRSRHGMPPSHVGVSHSPIAFADT
ncbi:helix-turn-helix transcriptional regulator [Pigmentiphaga aceris]|uniref:Helix-turn-helix transcriptional regulator n=1 Tax=Pigmentiphaga aceris TaxID=1940612 RepID=A0A5C0B5Z4_9BURK|nr:helix-turn-helix transcriptional regulator [Pigmentiphaga aceris]QEI08281.1 helix-turn-helix transcriptional regulator [Pigmentiphaga aceris]